MFDSLFPSHWTTLRKLMWLKLKGASAVWDTITGNPVSFTAKAAPLRQLKVAFSPVQSLNGYDSPWPAGGGKNKFELKAGNIYKTNGETSWTYTINDDTLTVVVTAAAANWMRFKVFEITQDMVGKKYVQSFIRDPVSNDRWFTQYDPSAGTDSIIYANPVTISQDMVGKWLGVHFAFASVGTYTFSNIQIEEGSTATSFAPYANECPISGWTGVNAGRTNKNLILATLTGCAINTSGKITADASKDVVVAHVKAGQQYAVTIDETNAVYAFYETMPQAGDTSYNGARVVTVGRNFYAPIDGYVALRINSGFATPQIEQGATPTNYVAPSSRSISISLGQTVYSGWVDVISGVLTVTGGVGDMASFTWNTTPYGFVSYDVQNVAKTYPNNVPNNVIFESYESKPSRIGGFYTGEPNVISLNANGYLYTSAPVAPSGQIYYELATPQTFQLTPQEVQSLAGDNVLFSDANGDLTVTYRSN